MNISRAVRTHRISGKCIAVAARRGASLIRSAAHWRSSPPSSPQLPSYPFFPHFPLRSSPTFITRQRFPLFIRPAPRYRHLVCFPKKRIGCRVRREKRRLASALDVVCIHPWRGSSASDFFLPFGTPSPSSSSSSFCFFSSSSLQIQGTNHGKSERVLRPPPGTSSPLVPLDRRYPSDRRARGGCGSEHSWPARVSGAGNHMGNSTSVKCFTGVPNQRHAVAVAAVDDDEEVG